MSNLTLKDLWLYIFNFFGAIHLGVFTWAINVFICLVLIRVWQVQRYSFWWWFAWVNLPLGVFYLFASAFIQ